MRAQSRAFTLVEVAVAIAVMLILAGAMVPMVGRAVQTQRESRTRELLKTAHEALFGARDRRMPNCRADFGFETNTLADLRLLVSRAGTTWAGIPAYGNALGFYAGWNGPYWTTPVDSTNRPLDAFGNPLQLNASWQVVSPGADRTFGTGDDQVYPPVPTSAAAYRATLNLTITKASYNVTGSAQIRFMYGASPASTLVCTPNLVAAPALGTAAASSFAAWADAPSISRSWNVPAGSVQLVITPSGAGTFPATTLNVDLAPGEGRDVRVTF